MGFNLVCGIFLLAVLAPEARSAQGREAANKLKAHSQLRAEERAALGRGIPRSEAKAWYGLLDRIVQDFTRVQRATTHGSLALVNEVQIVESGQKTLRIGTTRETGVAAQKNILSVPTALLKDLFHDARPDHPLTAAEAEERVKMLTGAIAQKLGSVSRHTEGELPESAGQADEFLADKEGIELLRKAGFPEDAIYEYKRHIFQLDPPAAGSLREAAISMAARDPEKQLQLSFLRIHSTLNRLKRGDAATTAHLDLLKGLKTQALAREAEQMRIPAVDGFIPPRSLSEAAIQIRELIENKQERLFYGTPGNQRLNLLLVSMDQALLEKQGKSPLTAAEKAELKRAFEALIPYQADHRMSQAPVLESGDLHKYYAAAFPEGSPSHFDLVSEIDFYKDPEFLETLSEQYQALANRLRKNASSFDPIEKQLWEKHGWATIFQFANPGAARWEANPLLQREIQEGSKGLHHLQANSDPERHGAWLLENEEYLPGPMKTQMDLRLARTYLEGDLGNAVTYFARLTPAWNFNSVVPRYYLGSGTLESARGNFRTWLNKPSQIRHRESIRALYQKLWNDRGMYQLLGDLQGYPIDWKVIAEVLGMDPDSAQTSVLQEYSRFVKEDPRLVDLLSSLRKVEKLKVETLNLPEVSELQRAVARDFLERRVRTIPDPKLQEFSKRLFHTAYVARDQALTLSRYRQAFQKRLADAAAVGKRVDAEEIVKIHSEIRKSEVTEALDGAQFRRIWAEAIEAEPALRSESRKLLLKRMYLGSPGENAYFNLTMNAKNREGAEKAWAALLKKMRIKSDEAAKTFGFDWIDGETVESRRAAESILKVLRRSGAITDPLDVLRSYRSLFAPALGAGDAQALMGQYQRIIANFLPEISERFSRIPGANLSRAAKASLLKSEAGELLSPFGPQPYGGWAVDRVVDQVLKTADQLELSYPEAVGILDLVTTHGKSAQADRFFQKQVLPRVPADQRRSLFSRLLKEKRIAGQEVRLQMAQQVLEPQIATIARSGAEESQLMHLAGNLEELVPEASQARDAVVESWAWRFRLNDAGRLRFLESYKTSNLARIELSKAKWLSGLSAYIGNLSPAARMELYAYSARPRGKVFPALVEQELRQLVRKEFENARSHDLIETLAGRKAEELKESFILQIRNSSPVEKVPLLDVLLNAGSEPLVSAGGFPGTVLKQALAIDPASHEGRLLMSYLDPRVTPERNRTVALSYFTSLEDGGGQSRISHIFNAFGFPGYRAGQDALSWQLLPSEFNADLSHLYDSAEPESLAKIQAFLSSKFRRPFRIVSRLGSASTVTVVEVAWDEVGPEGRKVTKTAAALIRRENALEQMRTHIASGRAYLDLLSEQGLKSEAKFVRQLIDAQEKQMTFELDLRNVGKNLTALRDAYEGKGYQGTSINEAMKTREKGWEFRVPKVLGEFGSHEDVVFLEKAAGTTFRRAEAGLRKVTGPLIAEAQARATFGSAYQANPHSGNFIVDYDPGRKVNTIWLLDGGQIGMMSPGSAIAGGERYNFAQFVRAVSEKDARNTAIFGQRLAVAQPGGKVDVSKLEESLKALYAEDLDLGSLAPRLVGAFADQGIYLEPKFVFTGGIKSLIDAAGAEFTEKPEQFLAMIGTEVKRAILAQPVAAIRDSHVVSGCASRVKRTLIQRFLRRGQSP